MRVIEQAAQAARRAFYLSQLKCDPHPWESEPQSLRDNWIAAVKAALRVVDYRLVDPRDLRELLDGGAAPTTPDIGMGFDDVDNPPPPAQVTCTEVDVTFQHRLLPGQKPPAFDDVAVEHVQEYALRCDHGGDDVYIGFRCLPSAMETLRALMNAGIRWQGNVDIIGFGQDQVAGESLAALLDRKAKQQ